MPGLETAPEKTSPPAAGLNIAIPFAMLTSALAAWLYLPVMKDLVSVWWNDPGSTYGFLIPPLAFFVAWLRADEFRGAAARPENRGLLVLAAACLLFLTGKLGAGSFLCRWSMVFFLAGAIWTFWGRARLRLLLFPLVILGTMIPGTPLLNSTVSLRLQILSSSISTVLARAVGTTIYREGNQLYLAGIRLGVADACSGFHSIAAMIVAALLLGSIYCPRWSTRALLLALSVPVAVSANVLRITATALIADHRPDLAMGIYHSFSGWMVFLVGFGVLLLLAKFLSRLVRQPV